MMNNVYYYCLESEKKININTIDCKLFIINVTIQIKAILGALQTRQCDCKYNIL